MRTINIFVMYMAEIRDRDIYRFIKEGGGRATRRQIFEALGDDEESRKTIEEKLMMMARMGIVIIEGDEVRIR
jgi:hypothetical protein